MQKTPKGGPKLPVVGRVQELEKQAAALRAEIAAREHGKSTAGSNATGMS